MPKVIIPAQDTKKWRQPNTGELFGELFGSWNLDLKTKPGRIKINKRLYRHTDTDDDADFGKVSKIIYGYGLGAYRWWIAAGSVIFKSANTDPTSAYTQDASANTPTALGPLLTDIVIFEGNPIVSWDNPAGGGDLAQAGGSWTANWGYTTLGNKYLSAGVFKPLEVFNRMLIIGDGTYIHTIDKNSIPGYRRLQIDYPYLYVNGIKASSDRVWVISKSINGQNAMVFEWDGYSVSYNRFYEIETDAILSLTIKDNVPYILTNEGRLMAYNGGAFVEVAKFPIAMQKIFKNGSTRTGARWGNSATYQAVHQNGMTVVDRKIHIVVSAGINDSNVNLLENMMSGIWIYDEELGLYHSHSLSQYKSGTVVDYGSQALSYAGPITAAPETLKEKSTFLVGASLFIDNGTTEKDCLFKLDMADTIAKRGYFITPKIEASEIQNMWELIWAKFSQMRTATDKIIIKKRTFRDYNLPFNADITWTSTTTFTSTDSNFANAAIGDEIEIIQGTGSGTTVHILTISFATPTYTITIDEAITGVTGTAKVLVSDWVKVGTFTDSDLSGEEFVKLALGDEKKTSIQFKIELRGEKETPELEELIITSKTNVKAEL